tara:strand:+ start:389 stop:1117 length:729 start_codon:yes stop_codon:yes gene_type:complete
MKEEKDRLFMFPFFPEAFLVSTMLMSPAEVGAYMRLLCHSWIEDGIPYKNKSDLGRLAGVSPQKLEKIMQKFFIDDQNMVRNYRLEEVRKTVIAKREKRVKAGRLGGQANKQRYSNALANREANGKQNSSNAEANKVNQSIVNNPPTPLAKNLSTADRIGMEKSLVLIGEEINAILRQQGKDATGSVVSWGNEDDPKTLKGLRAREREIKHQLMGFNPREREKPMPAGLSELTSTMAEEMRL